MDSISTVSNQKVTLTESEFCRVVGISRLTAYRLRIKNKLPHCRVGSRILYTWKHVEQFLANHERGAAKETGRR
jgi:excisionase family DNA binding protein